VNLTKRPEPTNTIESSICEIWRKVFFLLNIPGFFEAEAVADKQQRLGCWLVSFLKRYGHTKKFNEK
jgi:hypothetical protein